MHQRTVAMFLSASIVVASLLLTGCSFDKPKPNGFSIQPTSSVSDSTLSEPSKVSSLPSSVSESPNVDEPAGGKESSSPSSVAVPTMESPDSSQSGEVDAITLTEEQLWEGFDWAKTIAEQAFYMKPLWTPVYAEGGKREYKDVSYEDASTVRFFMTSNGVEYLEKAFDNKGNVTDSLITSLIFVPKYPPLEGSMWAYPAVHNIHFSEPKFATGEYDPATGLPVAEMQFTIMGEISFVVPGKSCQVIDVSRDIAYLLVYDPENDSLPWRLDKWSGSEPNYSNSRLAIVGQDEEKCYLPPNLN